MFGFKKTRRHPIANRQSRFESLERRELFAGNIFAAFNPVTRALALNGDGFSNSAIVAPAAGGVIRIDGVGTTINGVASVIIPAPNLGAVSVNLFAGNDSIAVNDILMGSFNLLETTGNDRVSLNNVGVRGNVQINTNVGADQIRVDGLFQGNVTILSGIHDDTVTVSGDIGIVFAGPNTKELNRNYIFGGPIGGGAILTVNTSDGSDKVNLTNLDVDGTVFVNTGIHKDSVNTNILRVTDLMDVRTGDGVDNVLVTLTACPLVTIDVGSGNDLVDVDVLSLGSGAWNFNGGLGIDTLDRNGSLLGAHVNFEILL